MRTRLVSLFALLLFLPLAAAAQDAPRVEVFGGYSYLRADTDSNPFASTNGINLNGWHGALQANVTGWFSLVGDFSGHYGSPTVAGIPLDNSRVYSYLFGPRFTLRAGPINPFVHALFGGVHASTNPAGLGRISDTGFATAIGGGLDVNFHKNVAVRLVQADYLLTRFDAGTAGSSTQNNFRLSTGLVVRFGSR